ncbi:MAG: restriction endonuclease subunit S [Lachnospiraceae bacterium]|nr:restriction endonuclease subunit S [Lachnospiraceae bacterium]
MREMKESGVEWIGEIPSDWEKKRLKAVLCERNEINNPIKTDFILSLTNDRGVIPYTEKGESGNKSKDDLTGYKLAYPNDIVLNSMNVIIGSVGLSKYYGCVSPVYYMLYPRYENDCVRYYNYLFQTRELQSKLKGYGNGIMEIRMRIPMSKLNTVELPIPPYNVQYYIADYLDEKCSVIDNIIEKKQLIIEKLRQYRLSVISEMIANSAYPLVSLGKCIDKVEQGWSPSPSEKNQESDWHVLSLAAVKEGRFNKTEIKSFSGDKSRCERLKVNKGDFLLTRSNTREYVGAVCLVDNVFENTIFSDLIYRIIFNTRFLLPLFALYYFQSAYARQQIERDAHGSSSSMVKITHKDIFNWKIYLPSIEIQEVVSEKLHTFDMAFKNEIDKRTLELNKLAAYKKSLIYEVATGKNMRL